MAFVFVWGSPSGQMLRTFTTFCDYVIFVLRGETRVAFAYKSARVVFKYI